jgi:uncharacterized membrane protein
MHLRRHVRFYLAGAAGVAAAWLATALQPGLRLLVAGDAFFVTYLLLMGRLALRNAPEDLRRRAAEEDEGLPLIFALTLAAVVTSVSAIFVVLNQPDATAPTLALAVVSVPLGWATVHTLAAHHYANLYYAPAPGGGEEGGLIFPGNAEPDELDFLYFSFVVGMTAQVADVAVSSRRLRRTVLAHGLVAFFYNAVIVAMAVNVVVGGGQLGQSGG